MRRRTGSRRGMRSGEAPSIKVNVPAVAPTTPPDMGASTNVPCPAEDTVLATWRDVEGSMVEQSINTRSFLGRDDVMTDSYTPLTC